MALGEAASLRVVTKLRKERANHLFILRSMADAVVLAGEQVQDVRLENLEYPPIQDDADLLAEIILGAALSTAGGMLVSSLMRLATSRVIAVRKAWNKNLVALSKAPKIARARKPAGKVVAADKATQVSAIKGVRKYSAAELKAEDLEVWKELVSGFSSIIPQYIGDKLLAPSGAGRGTHPNPDPRGGDTPGTAVRRAALEFFRSQELATTLSFERFEYGIVDKTIPADQILEFERTLDVTGKETLGDTRSFRALSLFAEACIWLLMYPSITELKRNVLHIADDLPSMRQTLVFPAQTTLTVRTDLFAYWVHRLPDPGGDGLSSFAEVRAADQSAGPVYDEKGRELTPERLHGASASAARELVNFFGRQLAPAMTLVEDQLRASVPKIPATPLTPEEEEALGKAGEWLVKHLPFGNP